MVRGGDPLEGTPVHAYSPFDERLNQEHPCPPGGCEYQKGYLLVKLEPQVAVSKNSRPGAHTSDLALNEALAGEGVTGLSPLFPTAVQPAAGDFLLDAYGAAVPLPDLTRWYRANLAESVEPAAAVDSLQNTPGVETAEPDYLRRPAGSFEASDSPAEDGGSFSEQESVPAAPLSLPGPGTDPLYSQQWHLDAVHVPEAWAYLESQSLPPGGSRDIVVAVIDTGVDYTHPDLAANMWVNPPEFNGTPGVDDDGNGYVDDLHGADTVVSDGDPQDDHGHGTHVAGIVAAQADNGIGGVGVAYNTQIMALKAAQYSGVLAASDIAEAIYYAVEKGADVINMSFGGYARSLLEEDALTIAFGQAVLVAAAGNDGIPNFPCKRDMYPAAYNWVLGVMASTSSGSLAEFSNFDCQTS